MNDMNEITAYYEGLCNSFNTRLTRSQYRALQPKYSSSLIEKLWGSWTNFTVKVTPGIMYNREESIKRFDKNTNKIVISYVADGSSINFDFFNTLLNYCKVNDAKLGILWGKKLFKKDTFSQETFNLISPYLATKFEFDKDPGCIVQDYLIPVTQKNPLMNLDKLSTDYNTIVVGAGKQYLRMLPYKQYNAYRIACSTGTISNMDYKTTVAGNIDAKYHTFGAILLDYDTESNRYVIRNLIYKNNCLYDLEKEYTSNTCKTIKTIPAMILGDLHLPDEDKNAVNKTKSLITMLKPKDVFIHDVASWNSISHHEITKYFTKCKNKTADTCDLKTELECVIRKLKDFTKDFSKTNFNIVNSNHDNFIEKWLDSGEFIKDSINAKIGAELFIKYLNNKNILSDYLPKNCKVLPKNTSFNMVGYELSEHGDAGICGARGSINSFNKGFEKIVIGHTHSPEIFEKTVVVGTLSNLKVRYNQSGMTKWAQANVILHKNGTFQLVFI